jgi:hypothetical protein
VQNDSNVTDSFFLKGTKGGNGFAVSYGTGGKNIKSAVAGGTYWLTLAPGATKTIVVTVKAGSGVSSGATQVVKVLARSAGDSAKVDVVRGIVKV